MGAQDLCQEGLHISGLPACIKGLHPFRYEPAMVATDARVTAELQEAGYEVRSYSGLLLREPSEVRLEMGNGRWVGHFGTLSPFLRCAASVALVRMKKVHVYWWNACQCIEVYPKGGQQALH